MWVGNGEHTTGTSRGEAASILIDRPPSTHCVTVCTRNRTWYRYPCDQYHAAPTEHGHFFVDRQDVWPFATKNLATTFWLVQRSKRIICSCMPNRHIQIHYLSFPTSPWSLSRRFVRSSSRQTKDTDSLPVLSPICQWKLAGQSGITN